MYLGKIKQLVSFILLVAFISTISSCSTATHTIPIDNTNTSDVKTKTKNTTIENVVTPCWYTNTIDFDTNYLYGFGSGSSLSKATSNALAYITNSLGTTVSTKTIFSTSIYNDMVSKSINEHIKTSSSHIILSDYQIVEKDQSNGVFFVLLKINKQQLIDKLKTNIKTKSKNNNLQTNQTTMYNFRKSLKIFNDLDYIRNAITTLELIDPSFDKKEYLRMYNSTQQEFDTSSENIKIYINDNHKSFFYPPLRKFLQQRFTIVNNSDNATATIQILNNSFYENIIKPDEYHIQTDITVSFEDIYTSTTLNDDFEINASSNNGRQDAINKAKIEFSEQLNKTMSTEI